MSWNATYVTYVQNEGLPGLLCWSVGEANDASWLRAAFTKGLWRVGVPLYLPTDDGSIEVSEVDGWWLEAVDAVGELAIVPLKHVSSYPPSVALWILASKSIVEAVAKQQIVPSLLPHVAGGWEARWRAAPVRPADRARLSALVDAMPGVARAWKRDDGGVYAADAALHEYMDGAVDGMMRSNSAETVPIIREGPAWAKRLAHALAGPDPRFELLGLEDAHLPNSMARWIGAAVEIGAGARPLVGFRLAEPKTARGRWRLSFHLQSAGGSERVSAAALAKPVGASQKVIDRMEAPEETLLEALGRCASIYPPLHRALKQKLPAAVNIDPTEAWEFLTSGSLQLERAGYFVEVPAALSRLGRRRVRARMRVGAPAEDHADERQSRGLVKGLVAFRWEASLGDDSLTSEEFIELTRSKAPLVHHRGEWIAVDPVDVARLRALIGEGEGNLSASEALRLALTGEAPLVEGASAHLANVVADGQVADALQRLKDGVEGGVEILEPPETLKATLRPYQARGFSWLHNVTGTGFGACLADDMGLGKTIQLLTLIAKLDSERAKDDPIVVGLVICPTSVIGNWRREARRFFPRLRTYIHHGPSRPQTLEAFESTLKGGQLDLGDDPTAPALVLTSYALARRDKELLSQVAFDLLVLDEAQNIKNPDAAQSRAVRELNGARRIALTGTPVENRLMELWSIIDFLNPGLLGSRSTFKHQFATPIERYGEEDAAARLRNVTAPFILRRVKTDPTIAPELPDKVEVVRYCALTREQAALYQSTVDAGMQELTDIGEGIQRQGRILAMLTAIKQICNHPAQFLKDGNGDPSRSGKMTRFLQVFARVRSNGGHPLIFTQYREMGEILQTVLQARTGVDVPFLHGGVSRQNREKMVKNFQANDGPPAMLVSLRAGGTGLNLTRANHVFHFDRWWNPAVEDQATDRAFRIGQTRDVTVHRMVCQGTLEEQIHQILEEKRALAGQVVGSGETWLGDLDNATLNEIVTLGQDAILEEEAW